MFCYYIIYPSLTTFPIQLPFIISNNPELVAKVQLFSFAVFNTGASLPHLPSGTSIWKNYPGFGNGVYRISPYMLRLDNVVLNYLNVVGIPSKRVIKRDNMTNYFIDLFIDLIIIFYLLIICKA